jgi:hypothetical protein
MALFGKSEPAATDPALEAAILSEDERIRKMTKKALSKEQVGILAALAPEETVVTVIGQWIPTSIVLLTNQRLIRIRKGRIRQQFAYSDLAATRLGQKPDGNFMISIDTHTSKLYPQSDNRRYAEEHYIALEFGDPKAARDVCLIIDSAIRANA